LTAPQATVLVVDDEPINLRLLGRSLERDGHDVVTASDGAQALEVLAATRVDIVLLDVLMPGLDGYEVLERVQADPALRHIPIIMVSALDELDSVVRCIELGADDYLPKPFEPVLLRARITAGLARKRWSDLQLEYLEQVGQISAAAASVEEGGFVPGSLASVAGRTDELGRLARVFERMAGEIAAREQALVREVTQLRIEIDEANTAKQAEAITDTEFFRDLADRARELRER
jgi:two-component system, cell cycle response regulator